MEQIESKIITNNMKYSGIYLIINLVNNKFYVGSAKNLWSRKLSHYRDLRNNKHKNTYLQHSYNKYGSQNFIIVLLEKVESKNDLTKCEQHWIDTLDACNKDIAYNICPTAESKLGLHHSEETKSKMSKSMKGIKRTDEGKKNMSISKSKTIVQCAIDGMFIKEWESANYASKILNLSQTNISGACVHKHEYAHNFLWFFKSEYEEKDFNINKYIPTIGKKINQFDLDGKLIKTWDTYKDIRIDHKFRTTYILGCCEGIYKSHKGFTWKYAQTA